MVKWTQLQEALQNANGRRILFIDTCHSGGAYNRRLLKDAQDARIVVLSATNLQTLAQERTELGHGVFTHALIEGLMGKAASEHGGAINMFKLAAYVFRGGALPHGGFRSRPMRSKAQPISRSPCGRVRFNPTQLMRGLTPHPNPLRKGRGAGSSRR